MMGIEALWNIVLTLGIGLICYLLKELKIAIDDRLKEQKNDIRKLEDKFSDLRAELPRQYVDRDDFVRALTGLETRMNRGFSEISLQMQKMIDAKEDKK